MIIDQNTKGMQMSKGFWRTLSGKLCGRKGILFTAILCIDVWSALAYQAGDFTYFINTDNTTVSISGYTGAGGSVTIPNTLDGRTLTSIGSYAFHGLMTLTSLTIPDSVTSIGIHSFENCTNLQSVAIGEGVTTIDFKAFDYCASLSSLAIGRSVSKIEENAFSHCYKLKEIYFKGNAPDLGIHPFSGGAVKTMYYLPGTENWGTYFGGYSTRLWNPQVQTEDESFGVSTNLFGFTITGTTNITVVVEACSNLSNSVWIPLKTNILETGSVFFRDPDWTKHSARFYRICSP